MKIRQGERTRGSEVYRTDERKKKRIKNERKKRGKHIDGKER